MTTTTLALHSETITALVKPTPRLPISIRPATETDLKFIDDLQKKHGKEVAFASTDELLSYINDGMALIAEEGVGRPIGYCLYRDRYMKREDCGIVSQLVVAANKHRGLVGAALIQAMFGRVPYGVRLFCCWCAQDLQANHFWEALGFVPLAFRSGSRGKAHGGSRKETRMHIFWERRVRENDEFPFWYPSQTTGGRMAEARLVLPIPTGKHWCDELPIALPGMENPQPNPLPEGEGERKRKRRTRGARPKAPALPANSIALGGLRFAPIPANTESVEPKPKRPRVKHRNDPKHIAAARELRDRYLEQVNAGMLLPPGAPGSRGKYDVSRQLEAAPTRLQTDRLLDAA
jgi:N-acetylglutamate synthase-like GNAT family acetyltransferase